MKAMERLRSELRLPPVGQLGVVVADVERAVDYYSTRLGIGPFTVYEFVADKCWYGDDPNPAPYSTHVGKAMLGSVQLELVKPLVGESCFKSYLDSHGEGLQHLGFNVLNFDEVFEQLLGLGFKSLLRIESFVPTYDGFLKCACFDTDRVGGIVLELLYKSWLLPGKEVMDVGQQEGK